MEIKTRLLLLFITLVTSVSISIAVLPFGLNQSLTVTTAAAAPTISFGNTPHEVGASADWVNSVIAADLDGDGDLDIISGSGSAEEFELVVWENDGTPFNGLWPRHNVGALTGYICSVAVTDLDKDGDLDIISGSGSAEEYEVSVWENDGTPFNGLWTRHNVGASETLGETWVMVADLDGDTWVDIVSIAGKYGGSGNVTIWRNDGTPFTGLWSGTVIFSADTLGEGAVGDLDKDGKIDIIVGHNEYSVSVFRNDGTPFEGTWAPNFVGTAGPGMVNGIAVADLDGDGHIDLVTVTGFLPTWEQKVWRNDDTPFDGTWVSNGFGSTPAPCVAIADFNMDGNPDITTGSHSGEDYEVIVWENDGSPFSGGWTQHDVGATGDGVRSITVADLDRDGDPDIVSASGPAAQYEIMVWESLTAVPPQYTLTMAVSGNGTTSPVIGAHTYLASTVVTINATPATGWYFDHWTGDVANALSRSTTVTVSANKTVTANFSEIPALSGRIAFSYTSDGGNYDIYMMNADGTNLTRLTYSDDEDKHPCLSTDGTKIVFQSTSGVNRDICVMNCDGSNLTRLTFDSALDTEPAWSPDGTMIAYASNPDPFIFLQIYVMDANGANSTRLTQDTYGNQRENSHPAWSPDGTRIAFSSDKPVPNIFVMNADGSNPIQLRSFRNT